MQMLGGRLDLDDFWAELRTAPQRVLMLDYDGVIAPFHDDPMQAVPHPEVSPILTSIARRPWSRLVIVTGRGVPDVVALLGMDPMPEVWGSHGFQYLGPDGEITQPQLADEVVEAVRDVQSRAVGLTYGGRIEPKPFGVALHWRGQPPHALDRVREDADEFVRAVQAELSGVFLRHDFDGGIELLVAGRDKGDALRDILAPLDDYRAAYLGDDVTDEDAFSAAPAGVLTVLVRPILRPTAASAWLRPPHELLDFLRHWDATCASAQPDIGSA